MLFKFHGTFRHLNVKFWLFEAHSSIKKGNRKQNRKGFKCTEYHGHFFELLQKTILENFKLFRILLHVLKTSVVVN